MASSMPSSDRLNHFYKRDEFLEIMEEIIPWDEWVAHVELYYRKGKRGRPPMGIEKMLRIDTYIGDCKINIMSRFLTEQLFSISPAMCFGIGDELSFSYLVEKVGRVAYIVACGVNIHTERTFFENFGLQYCEHHDDAV